jgi:16S rRNA G966 N2-methylase RsmD
MSIPNQLQLQSDNPTGGYEFLAGSETSPARQKAEKDLFLSYVQKTKNYIEYGSGGSTFEALKIGVPKVVSVEGSQAWVEYMRAWKFIRDNEATGRLVLRYIDIGPTLGYSYPADDTCRGMWPAYSSQWIVGTPPSLVFVDGRFRVACALNAAIRGASLVMIHDFNRECYQDLLKYFDVVECAFTLSVLKLKNELPTVQELKMAYDRYKYDPR